jgi:2-polyprenyl-3-methyl-5-hydroxy-6-metoxy-1,4-benzoquinol methylase
MSLPIDQDKLHHFMGQMIGEMGAAMNAALVIVGDQLGLYKAMAGAGPMTPAEVARATNTNERYIREWMNAQAAGGYLTYHPATGRYTLPNEQALALADESSPVYLPGAFQIMSAVMRDEPRLRQAFQTGEGVGWHEHDTALYEGTERFFRPNYAANLISSWLPSLDGMEAKLRAGAKVADVGCGLGASTVIMAQAYPASRFTGFDYHQPSIEQARRKAEFAGVAGNVTFEVAAAKEYPGRDFDLVAFFDCLHDMGDPAGAAAHVRKTLAPDGIWMIVEPRAGDRVEDNLNPVGRLFYCASTMVCTPASRAQEVGLALGAQAGEAKMREIVMQAGFTRFRRAAETPFNLVFEARS